MTILNRKLLGKLEFGFKHSESSYYLFTGLTEFLEAVENLHKAGVTIDQIQKFPQSVEYCQRGIFTVETISQLSAEDFYNLENVQFSQTTQKKLKL